MPPTRKNSIILEGDYASGVLGTFRIIRGFATLQDLASISTPFLMNSTADQAGELSGHQRAIDHLHAASIKRYLQDGKPRFIPEIILSIRGEFDTELDDQSTPVGVICTTPGLWIRRKFKSKNITTHRIAVPNSALKTVVDVEKRIRRIDGNHRLHLAGELPFDATSPTKYLAPFCAVLLGPPGDANDDFVEAMLFHTINSTALPLDSEHALQLILGQAARFLPTAADEFAANPPLHLTRLLKRKIDAMPMPQRARLGATPATVLNSAARTMVAADNALPNELAAMDAYADGFSAAITDMLSRLPETCPELCTADYFIELASLAWEDAKSETEYDARINRAVATLKDMSKWLGREGLHSIRSKSSIAQQLFEIYHSLRSRIPKRVFLARWYPTDTDGEHKSRADLRLVELKRLVEEQLGLQLIDMGTRVGGTYQIPPAMYEAISTSDIVLADLTGVRPNVMIEVGFALRGSSNGRILLYYETTDDMKMPFDIHGFQHIPIAQAAEIHTKLKPAIEAIIDQARVGLI